MPYEVIPNQWGQTAPGSALKLAVVIVTLVAIVFIASYVHYILTHPKIEK